MAHSLENEICLGHLVIFKNECKKCKINEFNKNCDKYKPMWVYCIKENDDKYSDKRN